ncbi:DUF402 domain-containing protein [Amycolatopsis samaneae]|uniref:DUF402 domain-containing protein n=1 Tax=Amycolatopsis samaneae TaxID=664691 RepID=A0ABW5GTI2_9PSEU
MTAGAVTIRRYFRGSHLIMAQATRVVQRSPRGLLLWVPVGSGFASLLSPDGSRMREEPIDRVAEAPLVTTLWSNRDALMLVRPGRAHSVWWFFDHGHFEGWYVNLERPSVFWDDGTTSGLDTVDHALDLFVAPDGTSQWKDEEEFRWATGRPGYWSADEARAVRAEGRRLRRAAAERRFPFDGTWCDARVDSPPPPALEGDSWYRRPPAWALPTAA